MAECYLVRHGEAVSENIDRRRPLSALGRQQVLHVARLAVGKQARVNTIFHSGILRAQQTAEILAENLSPPGGVLEMSGLQPLDDPAAACAELELAAHTIMLVGHLPFMGRLAGLLLAGDPEASRVDFEPATVVCLEGGRTWKIKWILQPPLR